MEKEAHEKILADLLKIANSIDDMHDSYKSIIMKQINDINVKTHNIITYPNDPFENGIEFNIFKKFIMDNIDHIKNNWSMSTWGSSMSIHTTFNIAIRSIKFTFRTYSIAFADEIIALLTENSYKSTVIIRREKRF